MASCFWPVLYQSWPLQIRSAAFEWFAFCGLGSSFIRHVALDGSNKRLCQSIVKVRALPSGKVLMGQAALGWARRKCILWRTLLLQARAETGWLLTCSFLVIQAVLLKYTRLQCMQPFDVESTSREQRFLSSTEPVVKLFTNRFSPLPYGYSQNWETLLVCRRFGMMHWTLVSGMAF